MRLKKLEAIDLFGKKSVKENYWKDVCACMIILIGCIFGACTLFQPMPTLAFLVCMLITFLSMVIGIRFLYIPNNFTLLKPNNFKITKASQSAMEVHLDFINRDGIERTLTIRKPVYILNGTKGQKPYFRIFSTRINLENVEPLIILHGGEDELEALIQSKVS